MYLLVDHIVDMQLGMLELVHELLDLWGKLTEREQLHVATLRDAVDGLAEAERAAAEAGQEEGGRQEGVAVRRLGLSTSYSHHR